MTVPYDQSTPNTGVAGVWAEARRKLRSFPEPQSLVGYKNSLHDRTTITVMVNSNEIPEVLESFNFPILSIPFLLRNPLALVIQALVIQAVLRFSTPYKT